jgi:hypothetical protein
MSREHGLSLSSLSFALALGACLIVQSVGTAAASEVIVLRSGNAPAGLPDPFIHMLVGSGGSPLSPMPFTPADFDAACMGPNAIVVGSIYSPPWLGQLTCDPAAQWIGIDPFATPASALYCYPFEVQTCCICRATLSFCWVADDGLGDALYGGPNPAGVYLNGVAVAPMITGGNYAVETQAFADVTGLLHCGLNRLEVYNRDQGYSISGVMFSAMFDIIDCGASGTSASTWSTIKALYK